MQKQVEGNRAVKYTNKYTVAALFPHEPPTEALKRELSKLKVEEYLKTVVDRRFPKRAPFWVFGRKYSSEDVYIKLRVEIVDRNYIFVMSFHFSTVGFSASDFPYYSGERES